MLMLIAAITESNPTNAIIPIGVRVGTGAGGVGVGVGVGVIGTPQGNPQVSVPVTLSHVWLSSNG